MRRDGLRQGLQGKGVGAIPKFPGRLTELGRRTFVPPLNGTGGRGGLGAVTQTNAIYKRPARQAYIYAVGTRRLFDDYTGALLRIRRSSDNTEQDITAASNGDIDEASLLAFVSTGSGYVVKFYDQAVRFSGAALTRAGYIDRDVYTGIGGTAVVDLTNAAKFPNSPDITDQLTSFFEGPTNWGETYGTRLRGIITAPTNGNYRFWIASDDASDLYVSTDATPANKTRVCYVTGWTDPRNWTVETSQQSIDIVLVAGQKYYVEALHKEGGGGDNLAVGWTLPGGALERPIPSSRFESYTTSSSSTNIVNVAANEQGRIVTNGVIERTSEGRVAVVNVAGWHASGWPAVTTPTVSGFVVAELAQQPSASANRLLSTMAVNGDDDTTVNTSILLAKIGTNGTWGSNSNAIVVNETAATYWYPADTRIALTTVYDRTNSKATLYQNDIIVGSGTALTFPADFIVGASRIGRQSLASTNSFIGKICEACIIDRALSQAEINFLVADAGIQPTFLNANDNSVPYYYWNPVAAPLATKTITDPFTSTVLDPAWVFKDNVDDAVNNNYSLTATAGKLTLTNRGTDIWAGALQFTALWRSDIYGFDFDISVKVESQTNTHSYARAGILVTHEIGGSGGGSNNGGLGYVSVTPGNGIIASWASGLTPANVDQNSSVGTSAIFAPCFIRLLRSGNKLYAYGKKNLGDAWTLVNCSGIPGGQADGAFQPTGTQHNTRMHVALVNCSHNTASTCTAVFDDFTAANSLPDLASVAHWTANQDGTGANPNAINASTKLSFDGSGATRHYSWYLSAHVSIYSFSCVGPNNYSGIIDLNGYTLSVSGNANFAASGNVTVLGLGTLKFVGAAGHQLTSKTGLRLPSVRQEGQGSTRLATKLVLRGDLTIAQGTLEANGYDIDVRGNWNNYGNFAPSYGTVALAALGNQAVTGQTVFNNLKAEFSPLQFAGLKAWYDASDLSTFTEVNSTGGGSGKAVSQWRDKSGTGAHLNGMFNAAFTTPPVNRDLVTLNGRSVVSCPYTAQNAGPGNSLRTDGTFELVSTDTTFLFVHRRLSGAASGGFVSMCTTTNSNDTTTVNSFRITQGSTGQWNIIRDYGTPGINATATGPADNVWALTTVLRRSSQMLYYVNSIEVLRRIYGDLSELNSNRLTINNVAGLDAQASGEYAEILIFNRALDRAELAQVEGYLLSKWGIGSGAARTLTFDAGSIQVVNGVLTLAGYSGGLLSVRSSVSGSPWNLAPNGTRVARYLDVKDSTNQVSPAINPSASTNSGNNQLWFP